MFLARTSLGHVRPPLRSLPRAQHGAEPETADILRRKSVSPPKVEKWDFDQRGAMTLDRIREMFTPASHFRISSL